MAGYLGATPVPQATQHRESFTATAAQTTFATAGYTVGFVDVYLNGVHLTPADVTATNGSDVVLGACLVNDIVDVISHSAFEINAQTFTGTTTMDVVTATGVVTANAGVVVDNFTLDGTTLALSSGDFTVDVAGDIILDADGGDVNFKDAGTEYLRVTNGASGPEIFSTSNDGDLFLKGVDGGATITALTLDMSDAGTAIFNHDIKLSDNGRIIFGAGADLAIYSDGTNGRIEAPNGDLVIDLAGDIILDVDGGDVRLKDGGTEFLQIFNNSTDVHIYNPVQDKDILFQGNDGGSTVTALTLDMSDGGSAYFNHDIFLDQGSAKIRLGTSSDVLFFANGSDGVIDAAGDIVLDAAGRDIKFQQDGTLYLSIFNDVSNNAVFNSIISDKDIVFSGNDGGSAVTALTLDMSAAGAATFNSHVTAGGEVRTTSINTASSTGTLVMFGGASNKGGTIELSGGNNTGATGSGIVFKTGASTANPAERMRIANSGAVTMPTQPAFLAVPDSDQNNIAVNSDVTVVFSTEKFDQGSDFASNTFTSPVTGKYQLNLTILLLNVDSASNYYYVALNTSNNYISAWIDPDSGQDSAQHSISLSVLADMDASDTVTAQVRQGSGTQQTDIDTNSYFSGYLVA